MKIEDENSEKESIVDIMDFCEDLRMERGERGFMRED